MVDAVRLAPHDIRRVDACLSLSQFVSTFEVSAAAAMVETDTARVADSPGRQVIVDMPLTLRRTWDFIQPSANVPTRPGGHGTCRSVGSRARQGGATFHGVPIGNAFGTKVTGVVDNRPESFGELRIGVAGNPAENLGAGQLPESPARARTNCTAKSATTRRAPARWCAIPSRLPARTASGAPRRPCVQPQMP
ncbi:MAG: hypothetical protein NZ554_11735 [Bryobacteraceae bacterium]|nr:hypothetical protein [Bryobacteraceae bacterium]